MAKDKSVNPAAAQHKADKARALKKNKANVAAQRHERLAKRNPERLQRQIDELRSAEESGAGLRPKDRETLNNLQKEVSAIRKAREVLGDKAPQFGGQQQGRRGGGEGRGGSGSGRGRGGGRGGDVLGKRRRDGSGWDDDGSECSETDEDVRDIPMPRDTPPPIPRKPRRGGGAQQDEREARDGPHPLPARPGAAAAAVDATTAGAPVEAKTVYSAAPIHRDLRKEATARFVPAAVAQKLAAAKGQTPGKLLEPEELDRLEKQGYGQKNADMAHEGMEAADQAVEAAVEEAEYRMINAELESGEDVDIDEEAARFERELKQVEMEEVKDEEFVG